MMKKSKYLFAVAALVVAMFCAAVGGATFAAKADEPTYVAESSNDIMEYVGSTAFASGVTVGNGDYAIKCDWLGIIVNTDAHGIEFKMKSSAKWADWTGILINYGATDVIIEREDSNALYIAIDGNAGDWRRLTSGGNDGRIQITDVDETVEHTYKITRSKATGGG